MALLLVPVCLIKAVTVCHLIIFVMQSTFESIFGNITQKRAVTKRQKKHTVSKFSLLQTQFYTFDYFPPTIQKLCNYSELTDLSENASRCGTYRAILKAQR